MNPREIAVVVALAISVLGLLFEFIRAQLGLRGFGDLRKELAAITAGLSGDIDRDGDDLLLGGHYGQWPVLVRFSRSEYEAGVNISMPVPSNLTLFCYPNAHHGEEGQVSLQISDQRFMSMFRLSTNNSPLEVSMILSSPAVLAELSRIMDAQSYLTLENRTLQLAEAVIVPEHLAQRTLNAVRGMARIASEATEVHGGSGVAPAAPKAKRNWFRVGYLTASAAILLGLGVQAIWHRQKPAEAQTVSTPVGIPGNLAAQIPQLQGWHVAEPGNFDLDAVTWLQQEGEHASGTITANLGDQGGDTAYILKRPAGAPGTNANRIVLFINNQERYDAEMPQIDVAARISKGNLGSVEWNGRGPNVAPSGDGILLIRKYRDSSSALIFFMSGSRLVTAVPKDFHSLTLQ